MAATARPGAPYPAAMAIIKKAMSVIDMIKLYRCREKCQLIKILSAVYLKQFLAETIKPPETKGNER